MSANEQSDICCICLDPLKQFEFDRFSQSIDTTKLAKIVLLDCKHAFHFNCIKKISGIKCPLCRTDIINKTNFSKMCTTNHKINSYFYSSPITKKGLCSVCKKPSFNFYLRSKILKEKNSFSLYNAKKKCAKLFFWINKQRAK